MATAARTFRKKVDRRRRAGSYRYGCDTGQGTYHAYRQARQKYLALNPLCEDCLTEGRTTKAEELHHMQKVSHGGRLLSFDNFRSLCVPCHARRTARGE